MASIHFTWQQRLYFTNYSQIKGYWSLYNAYTHKKFPTSSLQVYNLMCLSRDRGNCSTHHQKYHLKNHPKDILHDKNYLYGIVLIHLTSNVVFKTRNHFQNKKPFVDGWILNFFKNRKYSKFRLTASLPACLTAYPHSQA